MKEVDAPARSGETVGVTRNEARELEIEGSISRRKNFCPGMAGENVCREEMGL